MLFIIYGTTIPFNFNMDRDVPFQKISRLSLIPFIDPDGTLASIPDTVQNIFLFLPFGFLGILAIKRKNWTGILAVTLLGFFQSVLVETLQLFSLDRTASITDIVSNSIGSFVGAFATSKLILWLNNYSQRPMINQYLHNRFCYPLIVCLVLAVLAAFHPFDFTLDIGFVGGKIKSIIKNPFQFNSILRDEGVDFLRFFLLGLLWSLCLWEWQWEKPVCKAILISCATGIFLEGCQIIVSSRMPSAQDIIVIISGSLCGGLFAGYWPFLLSGRAWTILIVLATVVVASIFSLSPFQFLIQHKNMNWIPFLPYYEKTTFLALSNFIESMLVYFPMGFIIQYFRNDKPAYMESIFIAFAICFPLEYSQQWIPDRYADITDVLGAIAGALAGAIVCRNGWTYFLSCIRR